jgi:hypothetical protein
MTIMEMRDEADARQRLRDLYGLQGHDAAPYVQLLGLLCGFEGYPNFARELEKLSVLLWAEYRKPGMEDRTNRYTRSIINLANREMGFATQDNVVFAGPLGGAAFGKRVRAKVLWKDSFALGHGEFSHSYQWLVAGLAFNWGPATGQHYANVAGRMSKVPLFTKDNEGIAYRRSPLWEYLVDCTRWQEWFDNPANLTSAINTWSKKQAQPPHPQELDARLKSHPSANALTKETLRSANNVASLAAKQDKWFISFYEARRAAVLKQAQARGKALIERFSTSPMQRSLDIATRDAGARGGYEKTDEYTRRVNKDARRAVDHPIERIKADRAWHYSIDKGDRYSSQDKYVHEKPILELERMQHKGQYWLEFHGEAGFVNAWPGLVV